MLDRLRLDDTRIAALVARGPRDRRRARGARSRRAHRDAPERPRGRARAHPARRDRDDLRGAPERHRPTPRRSASRPATRASCAAAARRSRATARCCAPCRPGSRAAGLPRDAVQLVPTTDREAIAELRAARRPDRSLHPARRRRPDPLRRRARARAGDQALQGRLPRLRPRRRRPRRWPSASSRTPRSRGPACATRSRRCWSIAPSPTAVHPARWSRGSRRRSSCAATTRRARSAVRAMRAATEDDWYAEYLDLILAVRVVDGLDGRDRAHRALRLEPHRIDRHDATRPPPSASCARSTRRP